MNDSKGRRKGLRKIKQMRKMGLIEPPPAPWPKGVFSGFYAGSEELSEFSGAAGKRAHELGRAHEFTSEEAKAAASKRWKK